MTKATHALDPLLEVVLIQAVGVRVRKRRQALKLTVYELAERMGTTAPTISRLETGQMGTRAMWLIRLAAALHCEVGELFPTIDEIRAARRMLSKVR